MPRVLSIDAVNDVAPLLILTVRLRRLSEWRARIWIATLLIRLAARVMNCGVSIDAEPS